MAYRYIQEAKNLVLEKTQRLISITLPTDKNDFAIHVEHPIRHSCYGRSPESRRSRIGQIRTCKIILIQ